MNVKKIKKEGVSMKVWDLGGQSQYRQEWEKFARGTNVIIFMIDSSSVIIFQKILKLILYIYYLVRKPSYF